jgi:hypothetical protein
VSVVDTTTEAVEVIFVPCSARDFEHPMHRIGPGWEQSIDLYCGGIGPDSIEAAGERVRAIETLADFKRRADDIAGRCQWITLAPYADAHESGNVNRCSEYAVAGSPYCADCGEVFAALPD